MVDWEKLLLGSGFGIPDSMLKRGLVSLKNYEKKVADLLSRRVIPKKPWSSSEIEIFLRTLALMDTSNDSETIRIGEREARLSTELLDNSSFGFNHGVGRSGNISAPQPKAVGASLLQKLVNSTMMNLIKDIGIPNIKSCCVMPVSTGMSIGLALRALNPNPFDEKKKTVLFPRIDHTSPKKGIELMGYRLKIIETDFGLNFQAEEGVYCDPESIENAIDDSCFAIVSTSAFFAPRVSDDIKSIAKIAKKHNLVHIVNNAYGLQADSIVKTIRAAIDAGKVDAVISSTDKNFLCPIGGAVIYGPSEEMSEKVSSVYAGRATSTPYVQLMMSLLSMGAEGYDAYRIEQIQNREILGNLLESYANSIGEKIIQDKNPVSCAMTLKTLNDDQVMELGGYLYNMRITGPRVIAISKSTNGSCSEKIGFSYVVMNAAIGAKTYDIEESVKRLAKAIESVQKKK